MKKLLVLFATILFTISLSATWVEIDKNVNTDMFDHSSMSRSNTTIQFSLSGYNLERVSEAGEEYSKINFENEGRFFAEGKPNLPRFTRLIAIPDEGDVSFNIRSIDTQVLSDIKIYPSQPLGTESEPYEGDFIIDNSFYNGNTMFPQVQVEIGEPAIMRDYRVVTVSINAFQYDPLRSELLIINNIEIEVDVNGSRGLNYKTASRKKSRVFEPMYRGSLLNYESFLDRDDEYQQSSYLFIIPNNAQIGSTLEYLTDWKRQKGFDVTVVTTSEAGTSANSIKSYIQNAYDTWEVPPEYVVLVGDVGGSFSIPTHYITYYSAEGDHPYGQLEGNDILLDVILGRISIASVTNLQTYVAKVLSYEKEPYMAETDWYDEAILVGDPSSSGQSTIYTNQFIGELINEYAPNINLTEVYSGSYSGAMTSNLNSGVTYLNYRGYMGMSGFSSTNINALTNELKLSFAVFLTCATGSFASGESRSETFIRAGSAGNQKGAIAAIGTATTGTHTNFNNCVSAGMFHGIFADGIYTPGGSLNRGKLALFEHYPQNPGGHVNNFSHMNTLMGDPGVELWTGVPQPLVVDYESQVSPGQDFLEVTVENDNGTPLVNAWVTALMDDEIFATGYTDDSGYIALEINADAEGTAHLTVTKHNFIPHLGGFTVGETSVFVNVHDYIIDDDNSGTSTGNNDGFVNPGETIELGVSLQNYGSQMAGSVSAVLSTESEFVSINDDSETYGNIPSGTAVYSDDDFDFSIAENTLGGMELKLDLVISDNGGNEWTDIIFLPVEGANLDVIEYTIEDANGILDPGETATMSVTLQNNGSVIANAIYGELISEDSRITVTDADGYFGNVSAGAQAANIGNTFEIQASAQIIVGSQFMMKINLTNADGFEQMVHFLLGVGEVSITDPVGPDEYGYFCYDDGDVDYYNVPVYDWIEINSIGTNLNLNDVGNLGDSEDITLPITFRMYGEEYSIATICSNGWIAPGGSSQASFMNSPIPGPQGPSPMIAPFWDDLKTTGGGVYWYHDSVQHFVVIEWDNVMNDLNHEETFQAILYDTNYYPTSTGDSEIKFQYKIINNTNPGSYPSQHGQYASVGIEDPTGLVGLEYTFNNTYPQAAKVLEDEMALLITGPAIPMEEPFLILGGVSINDANGNGLVDYGEEVAIDVMLNNLGANPATGVSAILSTTDEYITIDQANSNYSNVPGGGSSNAQTDFEITVAEDCPDGHFAAFILNVTSNENTWELYFPIELNAPVVEFYSIFVDDGANNILDPGETCDVYISYINSGGSDATNVFTEFSETDPYVTLNSTTHTFTLLSAGSVSTGMINVTASASAPIGHLANVIWEMNGDIGFNVSGSFPLVISQVPVLLDEDFTGTYPPNGWTLSGLNTSNWEQSSTNNAGGSVPESKLNWSPSFTGESRLVSPVLNTSGSATLDFEFRHHLNNYSASAYSIGVRTTSDGGNTWNIALEEFPTGNIGPELVQLTVSTPDVGSQNFQIAFVFDGNSYNINYWFIDSIHLEGGQGTALGFIDGEVTLNGGTGNLEDVTITAGEFVASPNSVGYYIIPLPAGTYDVTANLDGYESVTETDIDVIQNQTTTIDFTLSNLGAPQNLVAEAITNDVTLEWEMETRNSGNYTKRPLIITKGNSRDKKEITRSDRDRTGFNVYRDGMVIAEIVDPELMIYEDISIDAGDYSYYVTALYSDETESLPSNTEEVTIVLETPTDLIATSVGVDIELEWLAPEFTRSLTGYKVYRDDEFIADTQETEYIDLDLEELTYTYYITAIYGVYESLPSNEFVIDHSTDAEELLVPTETALNSNYPNPFNPETTINFALSNSGVVHLSIYNIKGQLVKQLVNAEMQAGYHNVIWSGKDESGKQVSSGMYLYKMQSGDYSETKKMILMK